MAIVLPNDAFFIKHNKHEIITLRPQIVYGPPKVNILFIYYSKCIINVQIFS